MNIFRAVSDAISSIISSHKKVDPINKNELLDLIDNNIVALRIVVSTYESDPKVFEYIKKELFTSLKTNKDNGQLFEFYNNYVKNLSYSVKQLETKAILLSICETAKIILKDHEDIRNKFDVVFKDGTGEGDISLEQIKLSHATVFGFINLSSVLADWFCFFMGQITSTSGESPRIPEYRINVVRESGKSIADFVNDVLQRGPNRGILSVVQSIKDSGDVAIYIDSVTLDTYADIKDYPGVAHLMMNPFTHFQPILFIHDILSFFGRYSYKRNVVMRDWIQAKMVILQMDASHMDRESPEYARQQDLIQKYSDKLSEFDAKINRYVKG